MGQVGPAPKTIDWRLQVKEATEKNKIRVHGSYEIENEAQARVVLTLMEAYGGNAKAFLLVEAYAASDATSPLDILICYPEIGFLWVEVKGHPVHDIVSVSAPELFVRYGNDGKNAYKQAERTMLNVQKRVKTVLGRKPRSLFQFMVALPNIHDAEWTQRGFSSALDRRLLLLADDLASADALRSRISLPTNWNRQRFQPGQILTDEDLRAVRLHYGDSRLFVATELARPGLNPVKLGAYLDRIEGVHRLTSTQLLRVLSLKLGDAPHLIRGVAGSGKTIALAGHVQAYLSSGSAELAARRIAVVCHNHSLVPMLRRKIEAFWQTFNSSPMPWASTTLGTLGSVLNQISKALPDFDLLPKDAGGLQVDGYLNQLKQLRASKPEQLNELLFDVIFVDEAQDFDPKEFRVLVELTRVNPKSGLRPLILFYDDAQNIVGKRRPNWSDLGLDFRRGRSTVMGHCRRCTREIIELGFNVLVGSQAAQPSNVGTRGFADVSYLKANDLVIEHSNYVEIRFTETHGPAPMIERFESRQEEFEWVSSEIRTLLLDHGVRPEQIAVVFMRNEKFEILRDLIRAKVKEDNLRGFVDSFSDQFKRSHQFNAGHITIGTVGRLKGYEAPVVFVIAADRFGVDPRGRASFYVAVTRAKQLLYISGKRTLEPSLLDEAHRAYQAMRLFNLNRSQLELSEGCEAGSQPDSAPLASVF